MTNSNVPDLPFIKDVKGPRGIPRTHFWAVKPSGDYLADSRTGREFALAFMATEAAQPEGPTAIGNIVGAIIAAGDKSGVAVGFFQTIVGCSVAEWQPAAIERFRRQYAEIDKEVDQRLAALQQAQSRQPSRSVP